MLISIVTDSSFLAYDELLRVDELMVGTGENFIC